MGADGRLFVLYTNIMEIENGLPSVKIFVVNHVFRYTQKAIFRCLPEIIFGADPFYKKENSLPGAR